MLYKIFIDGASRGNPGPSAIGGQILSSDNKPVKEISDRIGITTNNQAEYLSLIKALIEAKELSARELKIYSDSELLVRQIKGEYKVKDENLKILFTVAVWLLKSFHKFEISYISREKNSAADALANLALDS